MFCVSSIWGHYFGYRGTSIILANMKSLEIWSLKPCIFSADSSFHLIKVIVIGENHLVTFQTYMFIYCQEDF